MPPARRQPLLTRKTLGVVRRVTAELRRELRAGEPEVRPATRKADAGRGHSGVRGCCASEQ
jgi:hypothetical protein